jgi:hypothetical protein
MNGKRLDGTMLMLACSAILTIEDRCTWLTVVLDILATPTLLISGKHIFWDDL